MHYLNPIRVSLVLSLVVLLFASGQANAADQEDAEKIVVNALSTFNDFVADPEMTWFRNHVVDAKAIMIVPTVLKAGFIFGGSGGTGLAMAHDNQSNTWSNPAFYTIGSVTFGLQIGGEAAEVVMLAMTEKGRDALLSNKVQLGADVSVAVGPIGAGAQAATTDILQFSRTKGVFGGLTLDGSVIAIRDSLNHAYYGKAVSPVDILIKRDVSNPQAAPLIEAVTKVTK
jgi:SH3 domain-containing YSC84-like protein 1